MQFMHHPTFIEELQTTHRIVTTTIDTLTRRQLSTPHSRTDIEAGAVPIQLFRRPRHAAQELYRIAEEQIEALESSENRSLSIKEKMKLREQVFNEKKDEVDHQVIEGVALALAYAPVSKIMSLFWNLNSFHHYVPDVFLESAELNERELKDREISLTEGIKFQYSRIRIAGVEFSQTIRYEVRSELKHFQRQIAGKRETVPLECLTVSWEIDPLFKEDRLFGQRGVLMNSGRFIIQPYVTADGSVDPSRSVMIYHIYIKIDPINYLINVLHELFSESEARGVITQMASAMRREALR